MVTLYDDDKPNPTPSSGSGYTAGRYPDNPPPDYSEATADSGGTPPRHSSPPPFSDPSRPPPSASSSSSTYVPPRQFPFTPLSPPTNYLSVKRFNSTINGTYTIDPTLPAPPGAEKPRGKDGEDLNLLLSTWNGTIKALIDLVPRGESKGPARFETSTLNGQVNITVSDRGQNRFRLRVTTANGQLTVRLPPTFTGIVLSKMLNGVVRFSPDVQRRLTILSEGPYEKRYFIGDFAAHGYRDDRTWHMDQLYLDAKNGSAHVSFTGDNEPRGGYEGGPRGFVNLGFCRFTF